ncbi:nucleotidyl transferase AbiEii/AbiGii toxin family protein [Methyloglobulus sp.]|uniref:nucleotidyl transferase AbiEii/AbiGii toxin family protein n=1 Tax=Methyloglobulus sp. TaxID=2518622 RepID=UPI0032B7C3F2
MTKNLLNISGKISEPIVKIYELIAEVANQNDTQFFIIGASARDIIFEHAYGIKAPRATRDIDLAVQVATWHEFQRLKDQLIATGQFGSTKMVQRLMYQNNIPVDIVPFGTIESEGIISWPPENDIEMNVTGFQDVYDNTQLVRLRENPELDMFVVTPAGLMVLKIMAWDERKSLTQKDALDIEFILQNYVDAGNEGSLWEYYEDLAADENHDYNLDGARILGRDMAKILSAQSKQLIQNILAAETGEQKIYRLVEAMSNLEQFEQRLELLETFKRGFND